MERSHNLQGLFILAALIALGGLYLWQNNQPTITVSVPAGSPTPENATPPDWQVALESQLQASTPLPTTDPNATGFMPPTLPPTEPATPLIIEPVDVDSVDVDSIDIAETPWPTPTASVTPDQLATIQPSAAGPTPLSSPTGIIGPTQIEGYQPPPEQVPLSSHANDHFWMVRPVDASANSASLFYYPFGSDGPQNEWRVHHGVDMPNDIGEPIHAGGSGVVAFAGNGANVVGGTDLDIYPSYGNVVLIEHDFGYRGQKIWTLYAHMSAITVQQGQRIQAGDVVGLIGGTGDVSGPHVHMEVRMGENDYFAVVNPLLWIAPYIGHGVIAGRVTYEDGRFVEDVVVTLSQEGRVYETTSTYVQPYMPGAQIWHVMPDPAWDENFVLGDVPAGDYTISVTIRGQRIAQEITVKPSTTNFVSLSLAFPATPQAVDTAEPSPTESD
ncbi:MAG: peptidoglycan DD-metalloendopeptidase family protein [Anaerolineae bacterium]|nr:peptidoglycan DD-metalloendopeptidase family protein [Anaerolineae bacterium]